MNINEALRSNLIVNTCNKEQTVYDNDKWRLVQKIVDDIFYVSKEEYSTEETVGILNLLERVNSGLYK